MESASAVIPLSEVSESSMIERGVPGDKIFVVPIGVDYNQDAVRRERDLPESPIVGSIISVVSYERLGDLIHVLESLPDVTCLTVRGTFASNQSSKTIEKWYIALNSFAIPRKDN